MVEQKKESVNGRQVISYQTTKDSTAGNRTQFAQNLREGRRGRPVWEDRPGLRIFQGPSATRAEVGQPFIEIPNEYPDERRGRQF